MTPRLTVSVPGKALREALGDAPDGVDIIEWDVSGPTPADFEVSQPAVERGIQEERHAHRGNRL